MKFNIPTLLLDENKCRQNIELMVNKAISNKLKFRPHFKTHQSAEIGDWFRESGVTSITVSSIHMAEYFAEAGWTDILVAFPVNLLEIDRINKLAKKINLHLLLESVESATFLINNLKSSTRIYLKIDTGYHRTGLSPNDNKEINEILLKISKSNKLSFTGILTHAGHAYDAGSPDEILKTHNHSIEKLLKVKKVVLSHFPNCVVSVGDTPTCSLASDFTGVDEIRPGNFVFYDIMQYYLGTCNFNQIAVVLSCPVVAKHSSRNEIVIYGGNVHLSAESLNIDKQGKTFGLVTKITEKGWSKPIAETYISSLSQEHGIIKTTEENFHKFQIGETIGIMPIHSCLTANLANNYTTLENKKIAKLEFSK